MSVTVEQGGDVCLVRLEGEINIAAAAELKASLLKALGSGSELRVDLRSVTELDVTALQLLWAAEREARGSGKAFALGGAAPESVLLAVNEVGLEKVPFAVDPS
jgi:anti-anti-sigma factor